MGRSLVERDEVLMKVKLKFITPFIVGGIKRVSNYIETLDYIPGNVIRAAFTRYILNNCSCFSHDEIVVVNGEKRKNWVSFKNKAECESCRLRNICINFQSIKFSFFYPEGTDIIPITTMRCKMKPEHRLIDNLTEITECPDCIKAGSSDTRVESVSGYIKNRMDYKVKKTLFTRTAIDKYTGTAMDGLLYSIEAVTGTDDKSNIIYEGQIDGISNEDVSCIEELRVGKYTSVGFGRCSIHSISENGQSQVESREGIIEKMKSFSERYKNNNKLEDSWNYIAIKFVADAKLDFRDQDGNKARFDRYISNDILKNIWLNSLNADRIIEQSYKIDKVYAEIFNFRGYDTSKPDDIREQPVHMIQKGSVIVFRTQKFFSDILDDFATLDGFGLDIENGFGRFKLHYGMEVL